jgi:hypothetical protein
MEYITNQDYGSVENTFRTYGFIFGKKAIAIFCLTKSHEYGGSSTFITGGHFNSWGLGN